MLEIHLQSDLHLDHYSPDDFPTRPLHVHTFAHIRKHIRLLVIAGDLATFTLRKLAVQYLTHMSKEFDHVVCVLGNHDFYGGTLACVRHWWSEVARKVLPENVHVLQEETFRVGDVLFCGTTMWTDARGTSSEQQRQMNDFKMILGCNVELLAREHEISLGFLLEQKGAVHKVVVSHHLPFDASIAARWRFSSINRFFSASLEQKPFCIGVDLWLHGHTHTPCDYQPTKRTRVVCNPRGYPFE